MLDNLAKVISKHCRWMGVIAIISILVPLYFLQDTRIDNSIEVWLRHESKEYQTYKDFLERYSSEEFIVVASQIDNPFSIDFIMLQEKLSIKILAIDGVARVLDLPGISKILGQNLPEVRLQTKKSNFLNNLIISEDGKTAGMFIWLDKFENPKDRRKTVEAIESVVGEFAGPDFQPHLAGVPLMNVELDRGSQKSSVTFLPVALGISVLVLIIMLRNISGVIASVCAVGVTTVWATGLMIMTGHTMNMVTVVLPSLLFVLSLSNSIHITSRFFAIFARIGDRSQALKETVRELIRPVFLSSITTAAGFGSLMISDMKPVADFGKFAAIGMLLSFFFNMLIVPGVLSLLHAKTSRKLTKLPIHFSCGIGTFMARRKWLVVSVSSFLVVLCIAVTTKAKVESNVLKFFPESSKISKDYEFVGEKLTGFYTVELEFNTKKSEQFVMLAKMKELNETISERPEVARVIDYGDIKQLSMLSAVMVPAGLQEGSVEKMFGKYIFEESDVVFFRMSVLINAMASSDFYSLLEFIDEKAGNIIGEKTSYTITGVVPLLNDVQKSLIDTQIRSFGIAAIVVLSMIGLFMRSLRAALASILPNILPIFSMFAIMVLLDIPLNAATVMIASVAIGIAADDTIHFLSQYRVEKAKGLETEAAVRSTLSKVGRAIVFTSIVITAGFSILCLAEFKPIVYFGLLTAITMLTALAGDMLVLPGCVGVFKLWEKKQ